MGSNKMFKEKLNDYGVYEYRGFKYTEEFKKCIKDFGFRLKIIIDNFLDSGISKIVLESRMQIQTMKFTKCSSGNNIEIETKRKEFDTEGRIYG